jgi:hypothetical protein
MGRAPDRKPRRPRLVRDRLAYADAPSWVYCVQACLHTGRPPRGWGPPPPTFYVWSTPTHDPATDRWASTVITVGQSGPLERVSVDMRSERAARRSRNRRAWVDVDPSVRTLINNLESPA